jgi:hypothetical protein
MIEGLSDFLSEEAMVEALKLGHDVNQFSSITNWQLSAQCHLQAIGVICDALNAFQSLAGKPKKTDTLRVMPEELIDKMDAVRS